MNGIDWYTLLENMKPKKGKLYTLELKWNVWPADISSGIAVWNRRLDVGVFLGESQMIGKIEYNKDMFIFLEDGTNGFSQKSPKILTSDGVVGYIVPNYNICSMKRVK